MNKLDFMLGVSCEDNPAAVYGWSQADLCKYNPFEFRLGHRSLDLSFVGGSSSGDDRRPGGVMITGAALAAWRAARVYVNRGKNLGTGWRRA